MKDAEIDYNKTRGGDCSGERISKPDAFVHVNSFRLSQDDPIVYHKTLEKCQ